MRQQTKASGGARDPPGQTSLDARGSPDQPATIVAAGCTQPDSALAARRACAPYCVQNIDRCGVVATRLCAIDDADIRGDDGSSGCSASYSMMSARRERAGLGMSCADESSRSGQPFAGHREERQTRVTV